MRLKPLLSFIVISAVAALVLAQNLDKPFIGHHDWNGVQYSNMARNFLRYGYLKTKLGQVTNSGIHQPEAFTFNTHHPSLLPILLSLSFKLFGISESTARLVPLLFTLGAIYCLYLISRKLNLSPVASFASGVVVFTPMLRYFGKMPVHEPLIVFFSALSVLLYLNFVKNPQQSNLLKLTAATALNGLTGWPGYFLYPLLVVHSYVYHRSLWRKIIWLPLITILTFSLHLFHTYILTGSLLGGGLLNIVLFRLNLTGSVSPAGADLVQFSWLKYFIQEARWLTIYYTRPLLISATIFLAAVVYKLVKKIKLSQAESIIFCLFIFSLSYPLIFSNAVFIHDYLNIFFVPFLGLSFAWIINQLFLIVKPLAVLALLVLTFLIATERQAFLQALQTSSMHSAGYKLGTLINRTVPETETAYVFSSNFANHFGIFVHYYADRQVNFVDYDRTIWDKIKTELMNSQSAIFTVASHRPGDFIDQDLATQSAAISYEQFNYYY
jgi:4-amino-4-deoxy-L-arabinose transferase-like glycosyltransferase